MTIIKNLSWSMTNIKTDRVNAVVFNLHQIKRLKFFFLGHPVAISQYLHPWSPVFMPDPLSGWL